MVEQPRDAWVAQLAQDTRLALEEIEALPPGVAKDQLLDDHDGLGFGLGVDRLVRAPLPTAPDTRSQPPSSAEEQAVELGGHVTTVYRCGIVALSDPPPPDAAAGSHPARPERRQPRAGLLRRQPRAPGAVGARAPGRILHRGLLAGSAGAQPGRARGRRVAAPVPVRQPGGRRSRPGDRLRLGSARSSAAPSRPPTSATASARTTSGAASWTRRCAP